MHIFVEDFTIKNEFLYIIYVSKNKLNKNSHVSSAVLVASVVVAAVEATILAAIAEVSIT